MSRVLKIFLIITSFCSLTLNEAHAWSVYFGYGYGSTIYPSATYGAGWGGTFGGYSGTYYTGYSPFFSPYFFGYYYNMYPRSPIYNQGQGFYEYSQIPMIEKMAEEKRALYGQALMKEIQQHDREIPAEKPLPQQSLPDPDSIQLPKSSSDQPEPIETQVVDDGNVIIKTY